MNNMRPRLGKQIIPLNIVLFWIGAKPRALFAASIYLISICGHSTFANTQTAESELSIPEGEQEIYLQQLEANVAQIQSSPGEKRFHEVVVLGVRPTVKRYDLLDKAEEALAYDNYTALQELLQLESLTITRSKTYEEQFFIHPYQPENSAFRAVEAILNEDRPGLRKVLATLDGSINDPVYVDESRGETALIVAISKSNQIAVRMLLKAGANPTTTGIYNVTPISRAVNQNNIEAIKQLLDAGVNVNEPLQFPPNRPTLLAYSVVTENEDLLKDVLARQADANVGDMYGWTPLMDAVHRQDWQMIQLLLPVSDPSILSSKPITETSYEKGLERYYPLSNAIFVAKQFDSREARKILKALQARALELGPADEPLLPRLDTINSTVKLAIEEFRVSDALQATNEGLALLRMEELSGSSDAQLVNHAIWLVLEAHQLSLVNGTDFSDTDRAFAEELFALGSQTQKWHDMIDVMHAAKSEYPQSDIDRWQQTHGRPPQEEWNFELLTEWIESSENEVTRDRLYDALDFFELN